MIEIRDIDTTQLKIDEWTIKPGECWAVVGRNGSGKKGLGQLIREDLQPSPSLRIALLSFEQQQAFYEEELKNDDTDFMDRLDPGTTVRQLLNLKDSIPAELAFLKLEKILDRGYRLLSSGESRKALLAQALLQKPDFLILDEPYDSLDINAKQDLATFFADLVADDSIQLLFLLNTLDEISPWHSHIAIIELGEIIAQGEQQSIQQNTEIQALLAFDASALPVWPENLPQSVVPEVIVELNDGKVNYGDSVIFSELNVSIKPGEHTLITGANGSGKSTLLGLITGDHPQCYGNDLTVLGYKRGSGESIWQLKQQIGIVTPDLHRNHRVSGSP